MRGRVAQVASRVLGVLLASALAGALACGREGARSSDASDAKSDAAAESTGGATTSVADVSAERPTRPRVNCGDIESWDGDGDGLSDALERGNTEARYYAFGLDRCDEDPSRAVGKVSAGTLQGGLNLVDRGTGYIHFTGGERADSDDWGTLKLIRCIEGVGRVWKKRHGLDLNVTDLSRRTGGAFEPHRSHQNGLDADIRYVRKDGGNAPLDLRFTPEDYDRDRTRELVQLFLSECSIAVLLLDTERVGFEIDSPFVLHAAGHSNHFHVRVRSDG